MLEAITLPNGADIADSRPWAKLQDPEAIFQKAKGLIDALMERHAPVGAVGLDGQMHGALYVDGGGKAVSPLATWLDGRGDLPLDEGTYASELARRTGCRMATGFGLTTHFWNVQNGQVPEGAAKLCTVADYVAMRLAGQKQPLIHASSAASLGLFDLPSGDWDPLAVENAGIDPAILPEVETGLRALGEYRGAVISIALGDNQASFLGSVREMEKSVLVNMGTGGQISMMSGAAGLLTETERRPLVGGDFILVGSSLCGGRAYQLLEKFLRSCASLAGCEPGNLYEAMNQAGAEALSFSDNPEVSPRFSGTRRNPEKRGQILGLSAANFDAPHLVGGVLSGMAGELYDLYLEMLRAGAKMPEVLIGSGNGLRKNPALRRAFELKFGMPLLIPAHDEEAAFGAALSAMAASGLKPTLRDAQRLIRYGG